MKGGKVNQEGGDGSWGEKRRAVFLRGEGMTVAWEDGPLEEGPLGSSSRFSARLRACASAL